MGGTLPLFLLLTRFLPHLTHESWLERAVCLIPTLPDHATSLPPVGKASADRMQWNWGEENKGTQTRVLQTSSPQKQGSLCMSTYEEDALGGNN